MGPPMVLLRARRKSGLEQLLERVRPYLPEDRLSLVEEAYRFAETCHAGQTRKSGDPYIVHPLDAAMTCADLQLDAAAVAGAPPPPPPAGRRRGERRGGE